MLKKAMLDEFKQIPYYASEETITRFNLLPAEIKESLMLPPLRLQEGMTLFECLQVYIKLKTFIEDNNINKHDPLQIWPSRNYWADIIYRTYLDSDLGINEEGFYLRRVIFNSVEVDRFRAIARRSRAKDVDERGDREISLVS